MKTILVVYTSKELTEAEIGYKTRYTFNTKSIVKVGDLIETDTYTTPIQVVAILPKPYKYFNKQTGQLSNAITCSNEFPIKEIKIEPKRKATQLVVGTKIPRQRK